MSRATRKKPLSAPSPPLSPLPPPKQPPPGLWRLVFPLLLAAYVALACLHAAKVPTGATGYQNAPDEAAHLAYARQIAQGHLPTKAANAKSPIGYEWHQPPLYYALAAPFVQFGDRAPRAVSIVCGVVAIFFIYRAARLLFPDEPVLANVAAGIAALTPTHIAITSTVNNDSLLEVCFSGALLAIIWSFHGGFTQWRAGWLGVAIGAALLTKATGLLLLPVALFALFLLWRSGESPDSLVRSAGWMTLLIVGISGWWYLRNGLLYGQFLPFRAFEESFAGTMQASTAVEKVGGWGTYLLVMAQLIFMSFWAVFGNAESAKQGEPLFLPEPADRIYWLLGLVMLTALGGLIKLHFRRKTEMTETQIACVQIFFATLGLVGLSFFLFILKYFQAQGRYLYPAMLPICLLLALGWRAVFPARYASLASGFLLALMGAASAAFFRFAF